MSPVIRFFRSLLVLFLSAACATQAVQAQNETRKVLQADFESPEIPPTWSNGGSGSAMVASGSGNSKSLAVAIPQRGNHLVSIPVSIDELRGCRVTLSARVKAEEVSQPAEPWNGVKLMLYVQSPKGPDYQGVMDLYGTFDWKELGVTATIPLDATEASIKLGIQDASGKVWFDDVTLSVTGTPRKRPSLPASDKLDHRTDLPRLRGVMYGPKGKEEDLRKLAEWKANLIRWQFYWYDGSFPEKRLDLARYEKWLDETMAEVDRFLPLCEQLGIRVVIDLHTPPGAGESGQWAMFQKEAYQKEFITTWDRLANHYKDKPAIFGYDLVNEPVEGKVADGLLDWRSLAEVVARRVRAIDPKRAIIIEPGPSGGWGNLPFFDPIDAPGIIYSVHMYEPLQFTHQGVLGGMTASQNYPGTINGVQWDKEKLREILEPVRQYQQDYHVPIYIGEFSAARWAPGDSTARYLRDCIALFEEFGWDWSYHAFREWHAWNVELGPDINDQTPSTALNSRESALREGFSKNTQPAQP